MKFVRPKIHGDNLISKSSIAGFDESPMRIVSENETGTILVNLCGEIIKAPYINYTGTVSTQGAIWVDNIAGLTAITNILKDGDVVRTKGFYKPNDGGGSTYLIKSSITQKLNQIAQESNRTNPHWTSTSSYKYPLFDNVTLIKLKSDLYADLMINEDCSINIRQLGGKSLESGELFDNQKVITLFQRYCLRKKFLKTLFIPSGHWCFSETNFKNLNSTLQGITVKGCGNSTVIMPFNDKQDFIWVLGLFKTYTHGRTTAYASYHLKDLCFSSGTESFRGNELLKALYPKDKEILAALKIRDCINGNIIENISFEYIFNTALEISAYAESLARNLRFYCCGGIQNGTIYPVIQFYKRITSDGGDASTIYPSATSAVWFKNIIFDSCLGPLINSNYGANACHIEFDNILIGGTMSQYNAANHDLEQDVSGKIAQKFSTYTLTVGTSNKSDLVNRDNNAYTSDKSRNPKYSLFIGGFSNATYWPWIFRNIQICNIDNKAVRKVNGEDVTFYCNDLIYANNQNDIQINSLAIPPENNVVIHPVVYQQYSSWQAIAYANNISINQVFKDKTQFINIKNNMNNNLRLAST